MDCEHSNRACWLRRPLVVFGLLTLAIVGALFLNGALFTEQSAHQPAAVVNPGGQPVESLSSTNQGTQDVAGTLLFGDDMAPPCPTLRKLNRLKHAQED